MLKQKGDVEYRRATSKKTQTALTARLTLSITFRRQTPIEGKKARVELPPGFLIEAGRFQQGEQRSQTYTGTHRGCNPTNSAASSSSTSVAWRPTKSRRRR